MGNVVGGVKKKKAKIMKIDGETFKLKLPATAIDVLRDYPATFVLLESEAVKRYGIRAPRLRPEEKIEPGKIYFVADIPKFPEAEAATRRTRSLAHMGSAKERLERLMLMKKTTVSGDICPGSGRVKIRLPRAQVKKFMEESKDETEVAERILNLCLQNSHTKNK